MLDALKVLSRPPGETTGSHEEPLPDPYPSDWAEVSDDPGFQLSASDTKPAKPELGADTPAGPLSARCGTTWRQRASAGRSCRLMPPPTGRRGKWIWCSLTPRTRCR